MKIALALFIFLTSFFSHAEVFCSNISSKADAERVIIPSDESGYKVAGKRRVYFHNAPSERCTNNNIFIIPGDLVNAYADYGGYTYVIYFTKEGKDIEGWVKSNRLMPAGTGIAPSDGNNNDQ